MGPRNRFQGMNSANLCSLAGRYDNPLLPRFLVPIDSLKIPARDFWQSVPNFWNFLVSGRSQKTDQAKALPMFLVICSSWFKIVTSSSCFFPRFEIDFSNILVLLPNFLALYWCSRKWKKIILAKKENGAVFFLIKLRLSNSLNRKWKFWFFFVSYQQFGLPQFIFRS